jgi:NAD(P)H dehydrogenase (quinone)
MDRPEILVTGATGMFGGLVVDALLHLGYTPRAVTRSPERAEPLAKRGAIPVVADMMNEASLMTALEGVDRAFLVSPMQHDLNVLECNFIDACKNSKVQHIVKLYGCVDHGDDPLNQLHLESIEQLKGSGLGWTLISPNTVMETNFFPHASSIISDGAIYAAAGDGQIGFVCATDCAEAAARVLVSDGHHEQDYQITGPQAATFEQATEILSGVLGREIRYIDLPEKDMLEILTGIGMTAEEAELGILCHYRLFRQGKASLVTNTTERLLGRPATSLREFFQKHKSAFEEQE